MKYIIRKNFKILIVLAGILFLSCCLYNKIGGDFPDSIKYTNLSPGARAIVDKSLADMKKDEIVDYHVHVLGIQKDKTGCYVNERFTSWLHPVYRVRYKVFLSASRVKNPENCDKEYADRLVKLSKFSGWNARFYIMAFDRNYNEDGTINEEGTEFYVPNEYVMKLASIHGDVFTPVISVHPYRKNALQELEKWAKRGVKHVKWLPNAIGIDPSHEKTTTFYRLMKKYNMILHCHGGEEKAVESGDNQRLGNPLLLRKPLDIGVRVIVAHCASLGKNIDLDNPGRGEVDNFDLFIRLMDDKKYEKLVFGDISAIIQYNRMGKPLKTILKRKDLHHRLVHGSDYPVPAVNLTIRTKNLMKAGYISEEEMEYLNEIYRYNPLLFDYAVKRTLHLPGTDERFPPSIFRANSMLE